MKSNPGILCLFIWAALAVPATYADSILCARKQGALSAGNRAVPLSKYLVSKTGTCPKGFVSVFAETTNAAAFSELLSRDGPGSTLDADTLDGLSSQAFATKTTVDDLTTKTTPGNVIRVGVSGGDYTSLETALASINSPSESNPYLVEVGPGTFTVSSQITIPSGVTLKGSGMNATTISGSIFGATDATGALVLLQQGGNISDLTITNTGVSGVGEFAIGIYASSISESITASPTSYRTVIDGVRVTVSGSGGQNNFAVRIDDADIRIVRSSAIALNAASNNYGIHNNGSATRKVYIEETDVYAGDVAIFSSNDNGELFITKCHINGADQAVFATFGTRIVVHASTIISTTGEGLRATGAGSQIFANHIQIDASDNAFAASGGANTCRFVSEMLTGSGYAAACE